MTRRLSDVTNIIATGFPSLMRQGLNSISVMILNQCSAPYGDAAIAAMSIVTRVIMFLFCIALGIGQGFQPVSAFNYGAKKYSRVREAFWFSIRSNLAVMSVSALFGIVFAAPIVKMFRDDPGGYFHRNHRAAYPVYCPVFHAIFPLWKYAVPEHRTEWKSNFFVHDSKRSRLYSGFVDSQLSDWAFWNSDVTDDCGWDSCGDYHSDGGEVPSADAGRMGKNLAIKADFSKS